MLTAAGLAEIETYADGIEPWKPYTGSLADVSIVTAKSLVADAHKAGLFVHTYTFRNEKKYLAGAFGGVGRGAADRAAAIRTMVIGARGFSFSSCVPLLAIDQALAAGEDRSASRRRDDRRSRLSWPARGASGFSRTGCAHRMLYPRRPA